MPWKREDGKLVIGDSGNPVYEYPSGDTVEFDADEQVKKIRELTSKSNKRKEKIEGLTSTLSFLSSAGVDITDNDDVKNFVEVSRQNSEKVKSLKDSEILKAGDVEKIKSGVATDYERKLENQKNMYEEKNKKLKKILAEKDVAISNSIIRSAFSRSKFVRERTAYPTPDIAFKDLKHKFVVEQNGDRHIGYGLDSEGNKIYSLKSPTELAKIDEAIEIVINNHPQKDRILLADGGGTGKPSDSKRSRTVSDVKTIAAGGRVSFGQNIEEIASGEVKVER